MTLAEDFHYVGDGVNTHEYVSNERFWFENDKVKFWYRYLVYYHTWSDWGASHMVRYDVKLLIDDESLTESGRKRFWGEHDNSIFLKEVKKYAKYDIKDFEKVINIAAGYNLNHQIRGKKLEEVKEILEIQ